MKTRIIEMLGIEYPIFQAAMSWASSNSALAATKKLFHEVAGLPLEEALKRGREQNQRMRAFRKA